MLESSFLRTPSLTGFNCLFGYLFNEKYWFPALYPESHFKNSGFRWEGDSVEVGDSVFAFAEWLEGPETLSLDE